MEYVIGIDLGTGSTKAVALAHSGSVIDSAQVAYPTYQPRPAFQEQEPDVIWDAFLKCIADLTRKVKTPPTAISLSSAMHSLIPVDRSGRPLMNMMNWADNRSASIARRIHQSAAGQLLYEKSGTPIHAMSPLCKILWLKENDEKTFSRAVKFISLKEYIWFRLFGVYEVDFSIASASGMLNIEDLVWNDLSLNVTSLSATHLSLPVNADHKRTCRDQALCRELGITTQTPFFIGASDGCLANLGSFATEEGTMALTIGTSGAVRVTSSRPMLNYKAMTFNYRLDDKTFVCGGPTNNGGVVLKWYAETFLGKALDRPEDYGFLVSALRNSAPEAEGIIFLPYLLGERAPLWNSDACGMFFGLRAHHRQDELTRAVVEGISMALYDITQHLIDTGLDIAQVHVSGGFVHSEEWLQLLTNIFGKRICLINTADASAVGAALLALKATGVIRDYGTLKPKSSREFLPEPQHMSAYRELFLRYRKLYAAVAPLMAGRAV